MNKPKELLIVALFLIFGPFLISMIISEIKMNPDWIAVDAMITSKRIVRQFSRELGDENLLILGLSWPTGTTTFSIDYCPARSTSSGLIEEAYEEFPSEGRVLRIKFAPANPRMFRRNGASMQSYLLGFLMGIIYCVVGFNRLKKIYCGWNKKAS